MPGTPLLLLTTALSLGCKGSESYALDGIWRFEVDVVAVSADSCSERLLHNLVDALDEEEEEDTGNTGWIEESDQQSSPWTGLGQFVSDGNGTTLIIGGMLLPQEEATEAGAAAFAWERSERTYDEQSHASGYRWFHQQEVAATTRIQVNLPNETQQKDAERSGVPANLTGSWAEESSSTQSWEEADLWPEELGIGETGSIPFSSYLTRLDELGYVVAASNGRTEVDCTDDDCVLSVNSSCSWSWELTATPTDISPDDDSWDELQWEAGI